MTANGVAFNPTRFEAFVPSRAESRLAGQGSLGDGDSASFTGSVFSAATPGSTAGLFDVSPFLTDGARGLGLSTFANNVGGDFTFDLSNIDGSTVGDGIPDLVYFNQAVPSSLSVVFEFFDAAGVSIASASVVENFGPTIARIQNDRFQLEDEVATAGQTAVNQGIQGVSLEFSDFAGLTQATLEGAETLVVTLPDTADPPFIAFNSDAFSAAAIPEPSSSLCCAFGVLSLLLRRKRA